MKKISLFVFAALFAVQSFAQVDDVTFNLSAATTNVASATYVVRGTVEGVLVTMPTGKTGTVVIATASGTTLFNKELTTATDGFFPILVPSYSTTAVALTSLTASDGGTNIVANAVYTKASVAEAVTATITPAAGQTGTSTYSVKLIVRK